MTSCDTLQKLPEEPKSGASAFHFPFMKLAVETRLEIYNYLLTAFPSGPRSAISKNGASHGVSLDMYTTWDADQEKKIACKRISRSSKACASIGLTPQILRTCKTIHQEAAPILYEANLFQFQLREPFESIDPNIIRQERLEYVRRELYQNPTEIWGGKTPGSLIFSPFAVFLRQIGQQNAASVKRLKFVGRTNGHWIDGTVQQAGGGIEVITQLLRHRVPSGRQVKICHGPVHWDEFEDAIFEPIDDMLDDEAASPFMQDVHLTGISKWQPRHLALRDEQTAMCRAIEEMVEKLPWLKRLSLTGFGQDSPTSRKIEELDALVNARC